jgi:hypothetical protein
MDEHLFETLKGCFRNGFKEQACLPGAKHWVVTAAFAQSFFRCLGFNLDVVAPPSCGGDVARIGQGMAFANETDLPLPSFELYLAQSQRRWYVRQERPELPAGKLPYLDSNCCPAPCQPLQAGAWREKSR